MMCGLCFMLGPFRSDVSLTHMGGGLRRWPRATPNEPRSSLQLIFDYFVGGGRTGLGLILTLFNHTYMDLV